MSKTSAGEAGQSRQVPFGGTVTESALESLGKSFPNNVVTTSKYTVFTFLPLNLMEQLRKAANVYFLLISIVMYISQVTDLFVESIKAFSTFLMLAFMMCWSGIMAAIDDYFRHKSDAQMNNQLAQVITLQSGQAVGNPKAWADVQVGEILVVKSEQEMPADMIPLACSGEEGTCYVSTANLDGETNLKLKGAVACTQEVLLADSHTTDVLLDHVLSRLGQLSGTIEAEAPQRSIHTFNGALRLGDGDKQALGAKEFLLRGTMLRNTAWCVGVVVYTGKDTRVVMNSRKTPMKLANIEKVTNYTMIVVLLVQLLLAIISDVAYNLDVNTFKDYGYIKVSKTDLPAVIAYCITFFILYSNLMPISLYATMELCNTAQAYFLKNDICMYDEETDSPAAVRSTNLCQELGQVEYIFSDKTGTLTQNLMELKRVSIAGEIYGEAGEAKGFQGGNAIAQAKVKSSEQAKAIDGFLEVLAVSHTVVVDEDKDGKKKLEAESPDEGALVESAGLLGWEFVGRQGAVMNIEVDGKSRKYTVVALNAFNSTRKRMSVIVQTELGEYLLLVKGADNVMIERAKGPDDVLSDHLEEFAKEGLRTLVIGRRVLKESEFASWHQQYEEAQTSIEDREGKLMAAAESVEKDLELLGATAIEDKLQVGVGETIVKIRAAGIKLWVLTGDKLETARNIGFSTRVLSEDMEIPIIDADSANDAQGMREQLDKLRVQVDNCVKEEVVVGLMVTGLALEGITENGMAGQFLELAKLCSVVIACRVSPLQKAQMVALVRQGVKPQPVTLAVGDGANDVPMIQEAQVGVGIVGKEGRQACNSADFAIGQFRFLQRLLLVHGRWNYRRTCKFTLYTFWRNAVQVLLMFYFSFLCGSSGTTIFEDYLRMTFNGVLSIPVIAIGCFDRDVDEEVALQTPKLYEIGRKGLDLNPKKMVENLLSAFVHSIIIWVVSVLAHPGMSVLGTGDVYSWGTVLYSLLMLDMIYRVCFLTYTWNKYVILLLSVSVGLYILFCLVYGVFTFGTPVMKSVTHRMGRTGSFWVCLFAVPSMSMVFDYLEAYLRMQVQPDLRDLVLEDPSSQSMPQLATVPKPGRNSAGPSSRKSLPTGSSYVFDHPDSSLRSHHNLKAAHPKAGDTSQLTKLMEEGSGNRSSQTRNRGSVSSELILPKESGQSNRPRVSALAQQKLPSWQFVLTWKRVLMILTVCGTILVILGLVTLLTSNSAAEIRIQYDGTEDSKSAGTNDDEFHRVTCPVDSSCTVKVAAAQDMHAPIWAFYIVDPFYQNYNSYVQSVAASFKDKKLPPYEKMFNDSFEIAGVTPNFDDIAWSQDMEQFDCPLDAPCVHKVVWTRPAAMSALQKPFMQLGDASFSKGQYIDITIHSRFSVQSFGARKELVLTTLTPFGGRSSSFGIFFLCFGSFCFAADLLVLAIQLLCPRRAGKNRFGAESVEQASDPKKEFTGAIPSTTKCAWQ